MAYYISSVWKSGGVVPRVPHLIAPIVTTIRQPQLRSVLKLLYVCRLRCIIWMAWVGGFDQTVSLYSNQYILRNTATYRSDFFFVAWLLQDFYRVKKKIAGEQFD